MTSDEIASSIKMIYELKKQISELQEERMAAEKQLSIDYKVDECNKARNNLALQYQDQITCLMVQISSLEIELGTKDGV